MFVKLNDKVELVEDTRDKGVVLLCWGGIDEEKRVEDVEVVGVDPCGVGCVGGVNGKSGPR